MKPNGDIFISVLFFVVSLMNFFPIRLYSHLGAFFFSYFLFLFAYDPDTKPEIKNHYRGHKLSMWLSLIPQIHSPGDSPDLSMRHHHFIEENPQFYDGKKKKNKNEKLFFTRHGYWQLNFMSFFNEPLSHISLHPTPFVITCHSTNLGKVRLQSLQRPTVIKISAPLTTATPKHKTDKTPSPLMPSMTTGELFSSFSK